MVDFSWVHWFSALVRSIGEKGRDELIRNAHAVEWGKSSDKVPILMYGDENIDPLSFVYFLAQKNTANQFKPIFQSVHEVFGISSELPASPPIIPTPQPAVPALFHNGESFHPQLLWRLFEQAARKIPQIAPQDFNAALQVKNVGIRKLTQTLFIVNPNHFLPADITNENLPGQSTRDLTNYEEYVARMEDIRNMFPGCEPYEINAFLYAQNKHESLIDGGSQFFHVSTHAHGEHEGDHWADFEKTNCVRTGGAEGYPITKPEQGDVILVRTGRQRGRAIGVVDRNGYVPDGWSEREGISVFWINKTTSDLVGSTPISGLGYAGEKTYLAFADADAYKVSFKLIGQLRDRRPSSPRDDEERPHANSSDHHTELLNAILFGPPGTSKTWDAVSDAVAIIDGKNRFQPSDAGGRPAVKTRFEEHKGEGHVEFITFHQNYAYEDFVEGIRPVLDGHDLAYKLHEGVFKRICKEALKHQDRKYVLVIDEINRGNIAKIFGELITLIEPSKRLGNEDEAKATLPYSQEAFGVPSNLYITGTMNTADRGIALLDTALRRRFHFVERMPDPEWVEKDIEGIDGQRMLKAINRRIRVKLDREHQIGHTYFIGRSSINELAEAFQHQIMPLLQEYFYDGWEKIWYVLNYNPFISRQNVPSGGDDSERHLFDLLPGEDEKWHQADSYQQIYAADKEEPGD